MKKIKFKTMAAAVLFAGICLVSCKDKASETEGGDTMGTETGTDYDETQAPTGEQGSEGMNPGADGETGTVNDTTSNSGNTTSGQGNTNASGTGNIVTGSGAAGNPNSSNRP